MAGFRLFDVLFNQPAELTYGRPTLIKFVVAARDVQQARAQFADTEGTVRADKAVFGRQVRAQLSGPADDVQIQPVGEGVRDISAVTNTTFDWYVTPKTTEPFKLTLRLYNRVYDGSQWIEVEGQPYVKEFEVKVSAAQQFELLLSKLNTWLALAGSSIAALVGLGWKKVSKRLGDKKAPEKA